MQETAIEEKVAREPLVIGSKHDAEKTMNVKVSTKNVEAYFGKSKALHGISLDYRKILLWPLSAHRDAASPRSSAA